VNDSAGYRFVDGRIMPITTEIEIESIEKVRRLPDKFFGVKKHIDQAQALFSKRPDPDYRNSIKESISAVEALCNIVSENEHASLGQAIDIMRKKDFPMHPAFITALDRLYGYTSNADGIRHSLLDNPIMGTITYIRTNGIENNCNFTFPSLVSTVKTR
jgi:hypothetical protein